MPTHTEVVAADGRKRYRGLYLNVAAAFGPPADAPATHRPGTAQCRHTTG
jgi:hypothetical protein